VIDDLYRPGGLFMEMSFKELGITINHLLRYGYGGILCFVTGFLITPDAVMKFKDEAGDIFSLAVVFTVGAVLYAFFRPVIGEWWLFNWADRCHRKREEKWNYKKLGNCAKGYTCKNYYLEEKYGVMHKSRFNAFRLIRDKLFDPERARRFEIEHSEIHLLYLTFTVLFLSSLYLIVEQSLIIKEWNRIPLTVIFAVISFLCLWFGIVADIALCRKECAYLMTLKSNDITQLLQESELVK
jgi:hypothetical protein